MQAQQKDAEKAYLARILTASLSFRNVAPDDIAELARSARSLAVQRGSLLAPPKGKSAEFYVIEHGVVAKLAAESEAAKSVLVGLFGAGDAIAIDAAFRDKPMEPGSDATRELRALTNVTAAAIPLEDFRRVLRRSPELADAAIATLAIRQSKLEARFALALQSPLEMRLAAFFSQMAAMTAGNRWQPTAVIGKLSQSFVADMLAVSREHVNRTLAMWEKSGLIFQTKTGDITVENRKRLMQIAGERRERAATPDGDALWEIDAHLDYGLNDIAYDLAQEAVRRSPRDDRFKHRAALALARTGALDEALALFDSFQLAKNASDEDILCLGPRLRRDLAFRSPQPDAALLKRSAAEYAEVYARTGGYYPGISAAATYAMAGEAARAKEIAAKVAAECARVIDGIDEDDASYYPRATLGEALLIAGDRSGAERAFAATRIAVDFAPGKAAATRKQLRRLAGVLDFDAAWIDRALPQRGALYFSGPLVDERAPGLKEAELASAFDKFLAANDVASAFGALAAGADIIIAERLLDAGVSLNVQLPLAPDAFLTRSVTPFGEGWRQRFIACLERAQTIDWNRRAKIGPAAYRLGARVAMGKTIAQARMLDGPALGFFAMRRGETKEASVSSDNELFWRGLGLPSEKLALDWPKPPAAKDDDPHGRIYAALTLTGPGAGAAKAPNAAFEVNTPGGKVIAFDDPADAIAAARSADKSWRLWLDAGLASEGDRDAVVQSLVTALCRPETAPGVIHASEIFADLATATPSSPDFVYVGHPSLEEKLSPCPLYVLHS
ncbi:MAG: Crp/Fnr family transcriptional regulator [Parvularculaceae bacterium]|nr:Crp/Fnr family transcriptional regulator [Parvularculaceae bacterium]